jgi:hypothetical protein
MTMMISCVMTRISGIDICSPDQVAASGTIKPNGVQKCIIIQLRTVEIVVRKMPVLSRSVAFLLLPALAFLSLSVRASPHSQTLPRTAALKLAARINSNGIKHIAAADRARARALLAGRSGDSSSINATNTGMLYTVDIGVGSPPTDCKLLVFH